MFNTNILELTSALKIAAESSLISREQASYALKKFLREQGFLDKTSARKEPKTVETVIK